MVNASMLMQPFTSTSINVGLPRVSCIHELGPSVTVSVLRVALQAVIHRLLVQVRYRRIFNLLPVVKVIHSLQEDRSMQMS